MSISRHKENIAIAGDELNREEGTATMWVRDSVPEPLHHWRMDETSGTTAYDTGISQNVSNGSNGVGVGEGTDGYRGKCYLYDGGSGAYTDCGTVIGNEFGSTGKTLSVSFWVYPETMSNEGMFYIGNYSSSDGKVAIITTSVPELHVYINASNTLQSTSVKPGEWYHVVWTYDSSVTKLYVNGTLEDSAAYSTAINMSGEKTVLGSYYSPSSGNNLDGSMFDVRMFDVVLTQDEINRMYEDTSPILSLDDLPKPVLHVPLDSNAPIDLASSGSNIDVNGAPELVITDDRKSWEFSGTSQYLDLGTSLGDMIGDSVTEFSVTMWCNTDATGAGVDDGLFNMGSFGGADGPMAVHINPGSGEMVFKVNNGSVLAYQSGVAFTTGWHHVAGTFDGVRIRLYIDGSLFGENAYSTPLDFAGEKTIIGAYWSSGYCFDGKLADVRFYNKALDDSQIGIVMNQTPFGILADKKTSKIKMSDVSVDIPDFSGWQHLGVTWKETQKPGLLYWNKLGNDTEALDPEVGPETILTGSATYGTSKFGGGIGFADYNNYLTVADLDISYAAGAFECWFKVRSNWNEAQSYMGLGTDDNVQPYPMLGYGRFSDHWAAYFYANSKKQKIFLPVGGLAADDPAKFSTGDVIHFAVSWNFARAGTVLDRVKLFINGVDRTSECSTDANTTNTWDQYTMEGIRLGGVQAWGADWSMYGYMSNVKIWNYEKTDFSDRFKEAPADVTKKLFLNGEKSQETTTDGKLVLPERGLVVGNNQVLSSPGAKLYDNIVVSKREFSEKEIKDIYRAKSLK